MCVFFQFTAKEVSLARALSSRTFPATNQSFSFSCYNSKGMERFSRENWSLRATCSLSQASKSRNKVDANYNGLQYNDECILI